jgi:hypothetical protein
LPPREIPLSDWLLFKKIFSETAWQNGAKLGRLKCCILKSTFNMIKLVAQWAEPVSLT